MALLLEGVNSNNDSYLAKDFDLLYNQLSAYEKKILTLLLKEYIENRKWIFFYTTKILRRVRTARIRKMAANAATSRHECAS